MTELRLSRKPCFSQSSFLKTGQDNETDLTDRVLRFRCLGNARLSLYFPVPIQFDSTNTLLLTHY